jgi:peroxiredoxin
MLKKNIYLTLFILLCICTIVNAQDNKNKNFTITANIKGLKKSVILLKDYSVFKPKIFDSVFCTNTKFKMRGEIITPTLCYLEFGTEKSIGIFLDNSDITISGHIDSLQYLKIENANAHSEFLIIKPLMDKLRDAYFDAYGESLENEKKTEKQKNDDVDLYWKMNKYVKNAALDFILKNKQSVVSPYIAKKYFAEELPVLDSLYGKYDFFDTKNENELYIKKRLEIMKSVQLGKSAPDFVQTDTSGNLYRLSTFKGKYVLLDFWASWCGPCRAETPNLIKAYNLYKDKGLEIISISIDDDKQKWKDAIKKDGMIWIQLYDEKGWNNDAARMYDVSSVPSIFLIDKEGHIVAKKLRGEALQQKLKEFFE